MKSFPAVLKGAETYFARGTRERGVLLLHGFTGNPGEMRYVAEKLHGAGFTVSVPRYPGHGTSMDEMTKSRVNDWYAAAREAYMELAAVEPVVFVAGLSMGGLFTICIAEEFNVPRIALMSVPRGVSDPRIYLAPFVGLFVKVLPIKNEKKGVNCPEIRAGHVCYEGTPVNQAWQLFQFMKRAMRALPTVRSSALIMQSDGDEVIPPDSAEYIFGKIGSREKRKFIFKRSNHVITNDYDRDEVAAMLAAHFS